jgi:CBS-domain-containing membrane protein
MMQFRWQLAISAGAFLAIWLLFQSAVWLQGYSLLMAPFGATLVLIFATPDSPLAKPRNVIGGHLLAAAVALVLLHLFGHDALVTAAAVALSILLMIRTHTIHPPAGATALVVMMTQPGWLFLLTPVAAGAVGLVLLAKAYHRFLAEPLRN